MEHFKRGISPNKSLGIGIKGSNDNVVNLARNIRQKFKIGSVTFKQETANGWFLFDIVTKEHPLDIDNGIKEYLNEWSNYAFYDLWYEERYPNYAKLFTYILSITKKDSIFHPPKLMFDSNAQVSNIISVYKYTKGKFAT